MKLLSLYHERWYSVRNLFSTRKGLGMDLILEYFENLLKSPVDVEIVSEHPQCSRIGLLVNSGLYNFVTEWQNSQCKVLVCLSQG